jgi:hypothetical protein
MGVSPAVFQSGGQISQHYIPGAYSRNNFVPSAAGNVSANRAVIMGDARAGEPNKLLWFSSIADANATLMSGPLLNAVRMAFDPGGGLSPQAVAAWRVNPGAQAGYNVLNGLNPMITLKAYTYGLYGNKVKIKIEAGTNSGKKLTVGSGSDTHTADDVYRPSLTITLAGANAATATVSISKTHLTTALGTPANGSVNLSVAFADFPTIEDVANYVNDQTGYTCVRIGSPTDLSTDLDSVTTQGILGVVYTAQSTLQAIIETFKGMPYIGDAVYYSGAADRKIPDNLSSWTYFTGGTDGAYTSSEWATSLGLLALEDVQLIGSSSEDASIHALIKAHCESMNTTAGRGERQFILGGAAGETVSQFTTRCVNLNSNAGMLCYPGFTYTDFDVPSRTKTWSPAFYAAKLIGQTVSLALNEPLTKKAVTHFGWEKRLTTSEIELCIQKGGCVGQQTSNGYVTVRSVNTYQGSGSLQQSEFSMMREALFMARDLRTTIENSIIGRAMTNGLLGLIDGIVASKLSEYLGAGYFNGKPPYWGYTKTVIGDIIKIEYSCYLTPPTNFVFITGNMSVFVSTSGDTQRIGA